MVFTGRGWLVSTSRAARETRSAYTRLLLLSGVVAVAWLAGGIGVAYGETISEPGDVVDRVMGVGETAERTGQAASQEIRDARLSETATRAATTTESLTDTAVPRAAALPADALHRTGVTEALDGTAAGAATNRAVVDTARVVDGTTRGTGELVGGIARTGHGVLKSTDESLRDSGLVDTVAGGLAGSTDVLHGGIGEAVDTAASLGLPVIGATDELAMNPAGPTAKRDATDNRGTEATRADTGTSAHAPVVTSVWSSAAIEAAEQVSDDGPGERIRLIADGAHHLVGADATGATAPSSPAPGVAGFLMARADHLAPRAQRVALPGDPTLVVRDAADDPSFAPD